MKATKCPSDEISLTNKVAVNNTDFPDDVEYVKLCNQHFCWSCCKTFRDKLCWQNGRFFCRFIRVSTGPGQHFVFAIIKTPEVPKNSVGFSLVQRKWAAISVNQDIDVKVFRFNTSSKTEFLDTVTLEVDFLAKKTWVSN